jgi:hypothetical protein
VSGGSVAAPRLVEAGDDPFVEVALGIGHGCALRASGVVACFGCDGATCSTWIEGSCGPGATLGQFDGDCTGKLGTGAPIRSPSPVDLSLRATQIDAGGHTCAIATDGALYCWGPNHDGQVGAGDVAAHGEPTRIADPTWIDVSVGYRHACAIREGGALYCWGRNEESQLGVAGTARVPTRVCLP